MTASRLIFKLWEAVQAAEPPVDVFSTDAVQKLQTFPEYSRAANALGGRTGNPDLAILLTVRALAIQKSELVDKLSSTELVLTSPSVVSTSARPTSYVIREMIESARTEVLLAGYRVTDPDIIRMLQEARRRRVRVVLLCGRADGDAAGILAEWPATIPRPEVYQDVVREDAIDPLMHIKALLVDSCRLLVSSANFTRSGMSRNIEFGICTDGQAALDAKTVLSQLINSPLFEKYQEIR